MWARSVPAVEVGDPAVPAVAVYIGNLVAMMRDELGYTSTEQYHRVKTNLREMGYIVQLRRGCRERLGAWALIRPPTVALWDQAIRRPFSLRREAALRENHDRALRAFLGTVAKTSPELVGLAYHDLGLRILRVADLVTWLVGRDERELRRLFPSGEVCTGYIGGPHVCLVPDLDPSVPSSAAGAWKRRADHLASLARLAAEGGPQ